MENPLKSLVQLVTRRSKTSRALTDENDFGWPFLRLSIRRNKNLSYPDVPVNYESVYNLVNREIVAKSCIKAIRDRVLQRGVAIVQDYWGKCQKCGRVYKNRIKESLSVSQYQYETDGFPCQVCEDGTVKPPDENDRVVLEEFIQEVNSNGQSLEDVLAECEDDLNIADDMYLVLLKKYIKKETEQGTAIFSELKQIVRGDPATMRISFDNQGRLGTEMYTCIAHRSHISTDPTLPCNECGENLILPVYYYSTQNGGKDITFTYIKGEVIHLNKFRKSSLYGFSPVLTGWYYLVTNLKMMEFIHDYYTNREIPSGALVVPGFTDTQIKREIKKWRRELKKDPLYKPVFMKHPDAKSSAEFIRWFDTLQEMQYIAVRDELRQRIGGLWGVSPVMLADVSTGGGLNNEGLQITVTAEVVKNDQNRFNQKVFPVIMLNINLPGWRLELLPSVEEDRMAEQQIRSAEIDNAQKMQNMGFDVLLQEDGHFTFAGEAKSNSGDGSGGGPDGSDDEQSEEMKRCIEEQRQKLRADHPEWSDAEVEERAQFICSNTGGQGGDSEENTDEEKSVNLNSQAIFDFQNVGYDFQKAYLPDLLAAELTVKILEYFGASLKLNLLNTPVINDQIRELDVLTILSESHSQIVRNVVEYSKNFFVALYTFGIQTMLDGDNLLDGNISISALLGDSSYGDQDAIDAYHESSTFAGNFRGYTDDTTKNLRDYVVNTLYPGNRKTLDEMINEMSMIVADTRWKLERIARSESQKIVLAGRERGAVRNQEKDQIKHFYRWAVRFDERTSEHCPEIAKRVKAQEKRDGTDGIPLEDLKLIVRQVQTELNGSSWIPNDWLPHPNCRSTLIRVV